MSALRLSECQLAIAYLYRSKAREALLLAQQARQRGFHTVAEGFSSEAATWHAFADEWSLKARTVP